MVAGHVRFSDGVIGKKQLVETPPEKFQWVTCASVSDTTVCRTPFFLFKRHKQTEGKKKTGLWRPLSVKCWGESEFSPRLLPTVTNNQTKGESTSPSLLLFCHALKASEALIETACALLPLFFLFFVFLTFPLLVHLFQLELLASPSFLPLPLPSLPFPSFPFVFALPHQNPQKLCSC